MEYGGAMNWKLYDNGKEMQRIFVEQAPAAALPNKVQQELLEMQSGHELADTASRPSGPVMKVHHYGNGR